MSDDLHDRREDAWFRERDRELIEKLKQDARKRAERERLAETTGLEPDHAVLEDLQQLGFGETTIALLHLVPLVQVAWAEGGISAEERALLNEAARAHGVAPGSEAERTLAGWLETRPDESFFGRALSIVRVLLGVRSEEEQKHSRESLVALCEELAAASGGLLGFGKVAAAEKEVIDRVAAALASHHTRAAEEVVEDV
jgi:hypothetical protein